jgi:ABC-type uncharacterized transport system ATPase subunit
MRKTLFAILLALVSMTTFAQRQEANATPEKRAETQTKTLTENLSLSEDQQKQVYNLSLARAQKVQELRDAQTQDRSQMRASMENIQYGTG